MRAPQVFGCNLWHRQKRSGNAKDAQETVTGQSKINLGIFHDPFEHAKDNAKKLGRCP
jgi:hypothetical protein